MRKLNAIRCDISTGEEPNMAAGLVVMAADICIRNQECSLQKMATLSPVTPATEKKIQTTTQIVDCDS
jgi:hypothetical protein